MAPGGKLYKETMVETVRDLAKGARVVVHFEARIKMQGNRAKVAKGERNSLDLKCGNDQPVTTDRVSPKVVRVLEKTTAEQYALSDRHRRYHTRGTHQYHYGIGQSCTELRSSI